MSNGTYQVIARRWRPQQFDEIVGQEHIVRTLKNAIETGRIGHAYLLVGPRGTGKTTTARIFAKALNCTDGPKVNPPADDPVCQAIVNGSCMDVIEIDAATNRSIEDAKTIRDECRYAPSQCKFKIFIIDEIHQLSKDAFNALLKTLEEPPPHIKFIFATTEAEKLLPTITSRCQRFEFQPIPDRQIAKRLAEIVAADGVEADAEALLAIARLANGGMRDSQSILDQAISFCGKKITAHDIAGIYGLASAEDIAALTGAMAEGNYAGVVGLSSRFSEEGRNLPRVLLDTQTRVREALLDAIRNGGQTEFLGAPLATEQLLRMLETLQAGESGVRHGISEQANFEVTLLKAVEQSRTRAIDSLIKELANLSAGLPREAGQKKIDAAHEEDVPPLPPAPRLTKISQPPPAPPPPAAPEPPEPQPPEPQPPEPQPPEPQPPEPQPPDAAADTAAPAPPPAEETRPPSDSGETYSAFDDSPPLETLEETAGEYDAVPDVGDEPQSAAVPAAKEVLPAAYPGSEDFAAALAAIPPALVELLDKEFRATFTALIPVSNEKILH